MTLYLNKTKTKASHMKIRIILVFLLIWKSYREFNKKRKCKQQIKPANGWNRCIKHNDLCEKHFCYMVKEKLFLEGLEGCLV